jgi:hypothetical protein
MDQPREYTCARRDLYDLVWKEPVRAIAKRLGVSDVGLAKVCRKADIPLPGGVPEYRQACVVDRTSI